MYSHDVSDIGHETVGLEGNFDSDGGESSLSHNKNVCLKKISMDILQFNIFIHKLTLIMFSNAISYHGDRVYHHSTMIYLILKNLYLKNPAMVRFVKIM